MLLETQRCARPMDGGSADGLADPGGKIWKVPGDSPGPGRGSLVQPGELVECEPFLVAKGRGRLALTSLEQNDLEALLAQLVGKRSSARTRADYHDDRVVIRVVSWHGSHLRWAWDLQIQEDWAATRDHRNLCECSRRICKPDPGTRTPSRPQGRCRESAIRRCAPSQRTGRTPSL